MKGHTISYPPELDLTQASYQEKVTIYDKELYMAYRSREVGPFEVVWEGGEYNYLLICKAETYSSRSWLLELIERILTKNNIN